MQLLKSKNFGFVFFHPFLLSLVIIVGTSSRKFLFFPPEFSDIIIFALSVLATALILFKLGLFFFNHDERKAGAFSSCSLVFIFFYFDFFHGLFGIKIIYGFIYGFLFQKFHIVLLFLGIIFLGPVIIFLKRTKSKLGQLTRFLNLFFFLILIFEISKIFLDNEFLVTVDNEKNEKIIFSENNPKRDIYYLVMDSYTSSGSLKKYWNYDNKELVDFLIAKGFFIAEKSKCNYNSTPFSILSILSMSYLNINNYEEGQKVHISKVFEMIRQSNVVRTLSDNGYAIANLSLFDLMDTRAYYADPYYHKISLFDRSVFHLAAEKLGISSERKLFKNLSKVNYKIIDQVPSTKKNINPLFCYAHPMMPHELFFFDELGNKMPDEYALNSDDKEKKYLKQLKYTNKLLMDAVETILGNSKIQPVIIIQGDHGFRYLDKIDYTNSLKNQKQYSTRIFFLATR